MLSVVLDRVSCHGCRGELGLTWINPPSAAVSRKFSSVMLLVRSERGAGVALEGLRAAVDTAHQGPDAVANSPRPKTYTVSRFRGGRPRSVADCKRALIRRRPVKCH
jgi:hypothetical protein